MHQMGPIKVETFDQKIRKEGSMDTQQFDSVQTLLDEGPETQRSLIPNLKASQSLGLPPKLMMPEPETQKLELKKMRTSTNKFGSINKSVSSSQDSLTKKNRMFN